MILSRLFLPQTWFDPKSAKRRAAAHVPEVVVRRGYQTKHDIVLGLIEQLRLEGMPKLPFLCDSGYGGSTEFRQALDAREEQYMAGVTLDMSVWEADVTFVMPKRKPGPGRNPQRMVPVGARKPKSVLAMAKGLPSTAWTEVTWREGSRGPQRSRFAAVRVRAARGYDKGTRTVKEVHHEEWLLVHWPNDEPGPTRHGCRTCRKTRPCCASCSSRGCAGASSVITRRARSCSGSTTTKGVPGTGCTTTSRSCCSRNSSSRSNGGRSRSRPSVPLRPPHPPRLPRRLSPPRSLPSSYAIAEHLQALIVLHLCQCCPTCRRPTENRIVGLSLRAPGGAG